MENQVPSWAVQPQSWPVWAGFPRLYRFDGGDGQFYLGSEPKGGELSLQILAHRWVEGVERWRNPAQAYLDLAFVDEQGVISVLSLKKDSALNLWEFLLSLKVGNHEAIDPAAVRVRVIAGELDGARGTFWAIEQHDWEFVEFAEFRDLQAFRNSRQFHWGQIGEVNG